MDRASLSRKTGWKDEEGHIFVVYPIAYLADDLGKSHMTVKKALNELGRRRSSGEKKSRDFQSQICCISKSRKRKRKVSL
ncbi:MAG: replication initiator protein A [Lacrimispora saccharolytica]